MSSQVFSSIKPMVWALADLIRDKGHGGVADYIGITVPLVVAKRTLDVRAELKRTFLDKKHKRNTLLELYGSLDDAIENTQEDIDSWLSVDDERLWTWRIEWEDLISYPDNPNGQNITLAYKDGLGGQSYTTTAKDKTELFFIVLDAFRSVRLQEMMAVMSFREKIQNPDKRVLTPEHFEEALRELNKGIMDMGTVSDSVFSSVYMDLIGRFAADGGKKGGEFYTPAPIVKGALKLLDIKYVPNKVVRVADPASGACSFLVYFVEMYRELLGVIGVADEDLDKHIEIVSQEKERSSKVLGDINVMLHGFEAMHRSYHGNSITEYTPNIGKHRQTVDYIVANPPYGLKDYGYEFAEKNKQVEERWALGVPGKSEGDYAFIETGLDLLSTQGKAAFVLPLGTLFKESTMPIRKRIIDNDWLEGVVQLPPNLFFTTQIPVCIWILNKNKTVHNKGRVFLVNSENDFIKAGKFNEWQDAEAVDVFLNKKNKPNYSGYVELKTLEDNSYNLSVGRYFKRLDEVRSTDINKIIDEITVLRSSALIESVEIENLLAPIVKKI